MAQAVSETAIRVKDSPGTPKATASVPPSIVSEPLPSIETAFISLNERFTTEDLPTSSAVMSGSVKTTG